MLLKIHTKGIHSSDSLHDIVNSKIRLILGRFSEKIQRVDAFLVDVNGPKGGDDKRCRLVIKLEKNLPFTVQDTSENILEALCAASHRGKRKIKRLVHRKLYQKYRHNRFTVLAGPEDLSTQDPVYAAARLDS
ncbi:Sigma 54 modulation protein / S30EA ribosomal protein [Alteromonadaceae bacterium Bs31]|nr:Sigma 54 modulation protein / S30EA ribosomal protein [Alteromonadaceae bacterium Bs31]